MEDHVHCAACHHAIATTKKSPSGHRVDVEIDMVLVPMLLPGPNGQIVGVQEERPACPGCIEKINAAKEQMEQQAKVSRLVVPRRGRPL